VLYHERAATKKGFNCIIGVDEAGRGPLAGPVVAAAVCLKKTRFSARITDSKKLSASQREKAYREIVAHAYVGVGIMNEVVIDDINILNATKIAMEQAISNVVRLFASRHKKQRTIVLVDGPIQLDIAFYSKGIICGDAKSTSIAAASIIAKVTRDRIMMIYSKIYPQYAFSDHKGYGTKAHCAVLRRTGPSPIHRKTFSPVKKK